MLPIHTITSESPRTSKKGTACWWWVVRMKRSVSTTITKLDSIDWSSGPRRGGRVRKRWSMSGADKSGTLPMGEYVAPGVC